MSVHICTYVCINIYTHSYIHIYTHVYTQTNKHKTSIKQAYGGLVTNTGVNVTIYTCIYTQTNIKQAYDGLVTNTGVNVTIYTCIYTQTNIKQAYDGLGHEYGSEEMVDVQRFLTNRIPADPSRAFAATLGLEGLIGRNDVKLGRTRAPKADCECCLLVCVCVCVCVFMYVWFGATLGFYRA